ncbi:MAG: hypothetical protein U9O94_00085 [Nanoarchaeota archaeon]|nr:hypothetical protein [Nanoarchaeota archaeon]
MKKLITIFLMLIVSVSFASAGMIGTFYIDEPFEAGEIGESYFNIRNDLNKQMDDVNVKAYIYELGLRFTSRAGDISKRDSVMQRVFMPIPYDTEPGVYVAKISVGNDKYRDTKHVLVSII